MATIDRVKVCTECLSAPRRVRNKKVFPLCEECRTIATGKKWKVRKLKRELVEGRLVQFNDAGWRVGYLIKLRETRADVQPIGAVGRIPDIIGCNIEDLKKESGSSKYWESVQDFYKANTRKKPVVLVADPAVLAQAAEVAAYFRGRNAGKPFTQQQPKPVEAEHTAPKPAAPTPVEKPKKVRGEKIIIGNTYGTWTVDSDTGHSRFACTCATCGKKKIVFSGYLRDGSAACEHK